MLIKESILNDGSTAIFFDKIPVLFYNTMYRKIFINRDIRLNVRIIIDKYLDLCCGYDIELRDTQQMIDNIYLINMFDYSKGECVLSPVYE